MEKKILKNEEEWISDAMQSLEGIQQAQANPFTATRVIAAWKALKPSSIWDRIAQYMSKPVMAASLVAAIVVINFAVIAKAEKQADSLSQDAEVLFSAEYSTNNAYSLEMIADR